MLWFVGEWRGFVERRVLLGCGGVAGGGGYCVDEVVARAYGGV